MMKARTTGVGSLSLVWPGRFALLLSGALLLALLPAPTVLAAQLQTRARNAIIMDAELGHVLYQKKADDLIPPASMSKIVTLLYVFDLIRQGRLSEDDAFVISVNAWKKGGAPSGGSTMFARPGERISVHDLIRAVAIVSANDASIALAEGIAGSEQAFARRLNDFARRKLGLGRSHFTNATGLPDPKHRMTVRELALAARYLIRNFPEHYRLYSVREFTWNGIRQRNRNPLLGRYEGADGVKTGYTRAAGYSLAASARRGGRRLIAVFTGLKSKAQRAEEARRILDWGFAQFRSIPLYKAGQKITTVRVWGGAQDHVALVTKEDIVPRLTDAERRQARLEARVRTPLRAPVAAGTEAGALLVYVGNRVVARYPLYTGEHVAEDRDMWGRAFDTLKVWLLGG